MQKIFLTLFYSGLSPVASGTIGSFVALILGLLLLQVATISNLFMLSILLGVIGAKVVDKYEEKSGIHDSKEIVIDELVGMWLALSVANVSNENMLYMAPLAFIYFRLFDIWKPSIIGRIDKDVKGGWGVMGDDMVAGIVAGIAASGTYQILVYFSFIQVGQ